MLRPTSYRTLIDVVRAGGLLFLLDGLTGLPFALGLAEVDGADEAGMVLVGGLGVLSGLAYLSLAARFTVDQVRRWTPLIASVALPVTILMLGALVVLAGPNLVVVGAYYVQLPLVVFVIYQRRWAIGITIVLLTGYALALVLVEDLTVPALQWLVVVSAVSSTAVVIGGLIRRVEEARADVADLNTHLEARVADQVDELERIGKLRRFLSPQVADVVVTRGSEDLLEPHRRDVAVLFCDLRGFTRFTNEVDADTVVEVLGEYYAAVGAVLEAHGATIGGYDGDGIMAYLGDPIPRDDAAGDGVAMARAIGERLDALSKDWQDAGHDLGYGIGLAHGTATLGVVGFDGRFDYTPLGAVVNLAARLCADAASGELVIDGAVRRATGPKGTRARGHVELKGFAAPVPTFALVR